MKQGILIALSLVTLPALGCGSVVVDRSPEPAPEPNHCPTGPFGGAMVEVPALDGTSYCVDATEVTNAQYAAFLATNPSLDDRPALCRNLDQSFAKLPSFLTFTPTTWPVTADHDDHPVVNINWCAAATFCEANGKRLCGRVGGGTLGGEVGVSLHDREDPNSSEWANACTGGGTKRYGYGNELEPGRCALTGYASDPDLTVDVGSPTCEGGFSRLFGLGGGVAEFIDDCILDPKGDPDPECVALGVNVDESKNSGCEGEGWPTIDSASPNLGMRCCADSLAPP